MAIYGYLKPAVSGHNKAVKTQGYGTGYERWVRRYNLKEMGRTLLFLKDQGIDGYDELVARTKTVCDDYDGRQEKIKAAEDRMKQIAELQKHIGTYSKTHEVYQQYRASGRDSGFYETLDMFRKK